MSRIRYLLLALPLILASCVSFPVSENNGATLLIIPVETDNSLPSNESFGNYTVSIFDSSTDKLVKRVIIPLDKDFVAVSNLEPGEYYISRVFFKYKSGYLGSEQELPKDSSDFVLESDKVTIAGTLLMQTFERYQSNHRMYMRYKFDNSGEIRKNLYQQLMVDYPEEMGSWELQPISSTK